jgi:hypothetical protein
MKYCLSLLALCGLLFAQEFRATLNGRVVDPSDAPIAGALIIVRNVGTNTPFPAKTDSNGNFTATFLPPGIYTVIAEMQGFKKAIHENVELSVGQSATLNLKLELGAMTQEVTVTDEAPLLDQSNAERGGVIDEQSVKEFPLNGRNPFMLSMLSAGVDFNGNMVYQRPFDNGAIADWSINGSGNRNNEFLLDGAPNNAQAGGNNLAYVPPVDSVQEFKIVMNSYDAQYGKSAGGVVNVVLKSGANRPHGSIYEFARRNAWDANSFQNNARGAGKDGHFLDQYGAQLDGPIYIPKVYNGRNRSFFLFNYERYREGSPQPLILSVPEPEMRNGDFSKLVDPQGRAVTIYDPTTGRTVSGTWTRDPFPGNIIPKDRINPISRNIVNYFPLPNTQTSGMAYSQQNYFVSGGMNPASDQFYNLVIKLDQNIGDRHHIFFRHGSNDRSEWRSTNGIRDKPGQDGPGPQKRVNDAYVIDWVGTLSATMVVNARVSFARYVEGASGVANENFDITTLGFPQSLASQLPYGQNFGRYQIADYLYMGRYKSNNITNTWATNPSLTKVSGSRSTKAGFDVRFIQYSTQTPGNVMVLGATNNFTQKVYNRADESSGNSIATWLLGTPSSGTINYNTFPIFMYRYMAPWVQHDWKILPRLTMNFGMRMDFNLPPSERFNRMNRGLDTETVSPIDSMIDRTALPDFPTLRGGLQFAGVNGQPRNAANAYYKTFQPRIGAAFSLTRKTVLRGGWGRYYMNPNNDFLQLYGFSQVTTFSASADSNRTTFPNKINDPFPKVLTPSGSADGLLTYAGRAFTFVNSDFRTPYIDQFSFGVQRALTNRARLEVTYSGSRGHDTQSTKPLNEVEDASFRDGCSFMLGGNPAYCDQATPNPFRNLAPFEGTTFYTNATQSRAQLLRPLPQFAALTQNMRNDGRTWYNSLQTLFNVRTRRGMNINVNYTFAKNITRSGYLDPQNDVMQQGLYDWDKPHRFVASAIMQLPFGKGRRWMSGSGPWISRIVGGWETTLNFQVGSGQAWNPPANVIYLKDARLPMDWSQERIQAFKPCVQRWNENNTITMMPFSVDYGCTEANWLVVPRYSAARYLPNRDGRIRLQTTKMADVSFNKMTRVTERTNIQFRAEIFNIANSFYNTRLQFVNNAEDPNFGSVNKSSISAPNSNYPRQIQLAVKFLW